MVSSSPDSKHHFVGYNLHSQLSCWGYFLVEMHR